MHKFLRGILRVASAVCATFTTNESFAQRTFEVVPLKYFGDDEGQPARGKLPANAGSLASVGRIAELGNGNVAVYDPRAKRIVVFDSAGKVIRHIGRAGKGPGEFENVLGLDYNRGRIATFDYAQSRVTIFDTTGNVVKTVTTGSVNHILLRGDTVWGAVRGATKTALWAQHINDEKSRRVDFLPVDTRHADFNAPGQGYYYILGRDHDGSALVASDLPGLFHTFNPGKLSAVLGKELLPGARYWSVGEIASSPGQVNGIVPLGRDFIGLNFMARSKEDFVAKKPPVYQLAIYTRTGAPLGFARTPEPLTRTIAASSRPGEFYYVSEDPYFRVVRAALREVRK